MEGSFHRRVLNAPSVSFGSQKGKDLFARSLTAGYLNGYFNIAEHYMTQGHPAFCGVGSLTMALNALLIDPKRTWQGVWRWFDENFLDCCDPLEVIRLKGITMPKLACLGRCNGADVITKYASSIDVDEFRRDVKRICRLCDEVGNEIVNTVMIVSYSRSVLNQSGTGHFSPIGAYDEEEDMILIMDVARFKYPPHWVPLSLLFKAMQTDDSETKRSRGYILLCASSELTQRCDECYSKCSGIEKNADASNVAGSLAACTPTDTLSTAYGSAALNNSSESADITASAPASEAHCKLSAFLDHKCIKCAV
jgi:glutathione gamma-glutamylcysteinyltransferase